MQTQVKPYTESELGKKEQVTKMFDGIAHRYDFLNTLLTLGIDKTWRRRAISLLKLKDNDQKVLDIATGTADMPLEIYKQFKPLKIIGLDISTEMIALAHKKVERNELSGIIELEVGDSENLRFEDNSFDAVTVSFGVRNFGNLNKGLDEIYRVLKPGGKLMVLEFTKPKYFPFKQFFNFYFKHILPRIGAKSSKDPKAYKYLYESVQAFPDYERFLNELKKSGFKNLDFKSYTLGICAAYTAVK